MQSVIIFDWLFVSTILCNQSALGWSTFYISPSNCDSWPADDYSYSLQDVINNQSYFFDSNTTLELMPGKYNITEKVGQLVIISSSEFSNKTVCSRSKCYNSL